MDAQRIGEETAAQSGREVHFAGLKVHIGSTQGPAFLRTGVVQSLLYALLIQL
jgi:hypothetical protein